MIDPVISIMIVRIVCALVFGMIIGLERIARHKAAGMRTYALVAMASAMFVTISEIVVHHYFAQYGNNILSLSISPVFIAAQVIMGIGFIGGGIIIHTKDHVENITTATAMWAAAAIGMACGFGYIFFALVATLLTLFVLSGTRSFEDRIRQKVHLEGGHPEEK